MRPNNPQLLCALGACLAAAVAAAARAQSLEQQTQQAIKRPPPTIAALQTQSVTPVDLASALRLAGVENPQILIARERVVEAVAVRQLAAAQILPSLRAGVNFDSHTGALQQSSGNILKVDRGAAYVGAGASAVGTGTVAVPGVYVSGNISQGIFAYLQSRQLVSQTELTQQATRNETLRRVANAYLELLRAVGQRRLALLTRDEAREVARLTAAYAQTQQGRAADADRAATELERRDMQLLEAEAEIVAASSRLAELLNLDPAVRLHPMEDRAVPMPVVPDPIPLCELLAMAVVRRPELGAQQAAIERALYALDSARLLPFSPNIILGYSAGTFGGGSNLGAAAGAPRFDRFGSREDFDAVVYWSLQNLGVGNRAQVNAARSRRSVADLEKLRVLNEVREQVADAFVRSHVRFAQIGAAENAVRAGELAYQQDLLRVRNAQGLPLALLDSLRLLATGREAYLNAIIDYNEAQVDLYVALGQPPADLLARPVPPTLLPR